MFGKLLKAALGAGAEIGDAATDRVAFQTLDWELRTVDRALKQALQQLADVMAMDIAEQRNIGRLSASIAKEEAAACKAGQAHDDAHAESIAERIADLRLAHDEHAQTRERHAERIREMRDKIAAMERRVCDIRREFAVARSTAALQRVQASTSRNGSLASGALAEAEATLARIQKTQQRHADRIAAAEIIDRERNGTGLRRQLYGAGLIRAARPGVADIMAELRARVVPA